MTEEILHFSDARLLSQLYANDMRNIDEAERTFGVSLTTRDDWLQIHGDTDSVDKVSALFKLLETARQHGIQIRSSDFHHTLRAVAQDRVEELEELYKKPLVIKLKRKSIILRPSTKNATYKA